MYYRWYIIHGTCIVHDIIYTYCIHGIDYIYATCSTVALYLGQYIIYIIHYILHVMLHVVYYIL